MSDLDDVLNEISDMQEEIRSLIEDEPSSERSDLLESCNDLLQQAREAAPEAYAELPDVDAAIAAAQERVTSSEAKAAELLQRADAVQARADADHQARVAALKKSNAASLARLNAVKQEPTPMAPDFVPPLRRALLGEFGYIDATREPLAAAPVAEFSEWVESSSIATPTGSAAGASDRGALDHEIQFLEHKIRSAAGDLSERQAVWWACLCVGSAYADTKTPLPPQDGVHLEEVCNWVSNPGDETRAVIEKRESQIQPNSPCGALTLAVLSWSDNPIPLAAEFPGPDRCQKVAAHAVVLANRMVAENEQLVQRHRTAIALRQAVADGLRPWPAASSVAPNCYEGSSIELVDWLNSESNVPTASGPSSELDFWMNPATNTKTDSITPPPASDAPGEESDELHLESWLDESGPEQPENEQ